jgi:circadian clock protein KaiB
MAIEHGRGKEFAEMASKKRTHTLRPASSADADGHGRSNRNWDLRLYVAGQTPRSKAAYENLKLLCERHVPGHYSIELIDLLKDPSLARADHILAIPTLVRRLPAPVRRVIGDLSDHERALVALDFVSAED